MSDAGKISSRHYYDYLPPPQHRCGNIWLNMPTFGLFKQPRVSGIVITPACDLSNNKTESVTYLPIVPMVTYLTTTAALPLIRGQIQKKLRTGHFDGDALDWGDQEFLTPTAEAIQNASSALQRFLNEKKRAIAEIAAINAAAAGMRVLTHIDGPTNPLSAKDDLVELFGSEWTQLIRRLITNAYSSNLHFLPGDDQEMSFSGVPHPSLVMFRYPITAPIEVFDLAREANERSWAELVRHRMCVVPALEFYKEALPLKALSLQPRFLADLLSRYTTVYSRIGSPDFTDASIERMIEKVGP